MKKLLTDVAALCQGIGHECKEVLVTEHITIHTDCAIIGSGINHDMYANMFEDGMFLAANGEVVLACTPDGWVVDGHLHEPLLYPGEAKAVISMFNVWARSLGILSRPEIGTVSREPLDKGTHENCTLIGSFRQRPGVDGVLMLGTEGPKMIRVPNEGWYVAATKVDMKMEGSAQFIISTFREWLREMLENIDV